MIETIMLYAALALVVSIPFVFAYLILIGICKVIGLVSKIETDLENDWRK